MAGDAGPVRERGIIMTGESVRAILAGRKTQTRRLVRFPVWASHDPDDVETADDAGHDPAVICNNTGCFAALPLPWRVGDRLWVRETWQEFLLSEWPPERVLGPGGRFGIPTEMAKGNISHVAYRADGEWPDHPEMGAARWRSLIHMPRWASRLTLAVTDVRVERLQDISEDDALAEGAYRDGEGIWTMGAGSIWPGTRPDEARHAYKELWAMLHGPAAWDANPWVAAISFEVEGAALARARGGGRDGGVDDGQG